MKQSFNPLWQLWLKNNAKKKDSDSEELFDLMKEAFNTVTILTAGKTGVGKSTLINTVFRESLAETGVGKPVTAHLNYYKKESVPIALYDTQGLELSNRTQKSAMKEIIAKVEELYHQEEQRVDLIWYCVHTQSKRLEALEEEFITSLSTYAPVVVVMTHYYGTDEDETFKLYLEETLSNVQEVVPVLAKEVSLTSDIQLKAHSMPYLVSVSEKLLPVSQQQAFANGQKVSIAIKTKQAKRVADRYALTAAGVSTTPLPFADATALVSLQVVMLAHLTVIFGISVSKSLVLGVSSAGLGSQGARLIGKYLSSSLAKWVPGGNVTATVINSTIAQQVTLGLATTYTTVLTKVAEMEQAGQTVSEEELIRLTEEAFSKDSLESEQTDEN